MAIEFTYDDTEYGYRDHTGDGAEIDFAIGFPFLNKSSAQNGSQPKTLRVYFDGVEQLTDWSVRSAGNVVRFTVAPATDVHIEFRRDSGIDDPAVQWTNSSIINQRTLKLAQDWGKFLDQELYTKTIALVDDLNAIVAAFALDDLDDVTLTAAAEGEFLRKSGADWLNVQIVEADISDLQNYSVVGHTHLEADITDLQAYLLDITGENIGDLSDVIQTAAADGELLRFDGSDWINNTLAEAGISAVGHTHVEADITDLTHAIITQDEGSTVTGGPHTTIDFVGAGVVATDAGSGVTTVTIAGGAGPTDLDDLTDVTISAPSTGQVLRKSGGDWLNATLVEADISDLQSYLLDITAEPIGDLSDVTITSITTNEILKWNGSAFINNTLAEAGISAVGHTHLEADITDLTKTIIVEDEGSGVAGGPHDTLDFVGSGVVVTDAGSGTATVTISSGGATDLDGLSDVTLTTPSTGEFLRKSAGDWLNVDIVEADISDLQAYLLNITAEPIGDLSDVTITSIATNEILKWNGSAFINNTLAEAGIAAASHTHLEADITDLQPYLLDITGEDFTDLNDTPADYSGAGSRFVKVNSGATALEFVADPGFLLDITGEDIGDLSDVTITAIAADEILKWNGSAFINNTLAEAGISAVGHTHLEADITDLSKTIVVEDEGSGVSGGPHDTLDFVGGGVTVNFAGSGTATITIPAGGATDLDGLTDVTLSTPSTGQFIRKSAGNWLNVDIVEADISDLQSYLLDITGEPIGDLSDVTITSIASNEILKWNGSAFINNTLAEAGISAVGHTHSESDITDLQPYLLDITGEDFTDLSDTPANYSGAGSRFVKVNSGATALEFVVDPGFLLDITNEPLEDLSDVTITTIAADEILKWTGSAWINNTLAEAGISATGHTHTQSDITDLTKTIIVEDEGSGVAGGPHDTLDFVGGGVTVTDAGGGTATITIPSGGAASLNDLTDVTLASPSTGEFLRKSAGDWLNVDIVEADISDLQSYLLDITAEDIGDLSDVTITAIAANEILKWNGSAFINNTLAEAGISATGHTHTQSEITDLTKTIIVEDEGSTVTGGPHDTLDFVGSGVVVTDAGSGTATVTISGGGSSAGDSDYVLVDRGALNQVVADHINRTVEGNARGTNAVDLQMLRAIATMVASATSSVIGGGEDNTAGGVHSVVCGGDTNRVDSIRGFTGGGFSNFITSSAGGDCVIVGGDNNTITGAQDSATIGGGQNNLTAADHATIPGGFNADGRRFGEWAYGGASAANAQVVQNVATALTTNATQTTMGYSNAQSTWLQPAIDQATIPFPSALTFMMVFSGYVIGMRANSAGEDACAFRIEGAMKKQDSGAISFVGNPSVTVVGRDDVNLDCDVVLAAADAGANVRVTGIAAEDWTWTFAWAGPEMLVPSL